MATWNRPARLPPRAILHLQSSKEVWKYSIDDESSRVVLLGGGYKTAEKSRGLKQLLCDITVMVQFFCVCLYFHFIRV